MSSLKMNFTLDPVKAIRRIAEHVVANFFWFESKEGKFDDKTYKTIK